MRLRLTRVGSPGRARERRPEPPGRIPRPRRIWLWAALCAACLACVVVWRVGASPSRARRVEQARRFEGVWREVSLLAPTGKEIPLSTIWGTPEQRAGGDLLTAMQSELRISRGVAELTPPRGVPVSSAAGIPSGVFETVPIRTRWRVDRNGDLTATGPLAWVGAGFSARLEPDGQRLVVAFQLSGDRPPRCVFERVPASGGQAPTPEPSPSE